AKVGGLHEQKERVGDKTYRVRIENGNQQEFWDYKLNDKGEVVEAKQAMTGTVTEGGRGKFTSVGSTIGATSGGPGAGEQAAKTHAPNYFKLSAKVDPEAKYRNEGDKRAGAKQSGEGRDDAKQGGESKK